MKQARLVGLALSVGILLGSLATYRLVPRDGKTVHVSGEGANPGTASQAKIDDVLLEVKRLQRVVGEMAVARVNNTKVVYVEKYPTSHEELDLIRTTNSTVQFDDLHIHADDRSVASELARSVRVLCWITTCGENLNKRAIHVRQTWGKRCNKLIFFSDVDDPNFPAVGLGSDTGREHLTAKTMRAFDYIYRRHLHDADWFMKADDDTYVIVENLRYMLSAHSPTEPVYFGHLFKVIVGQGYNSGGAGYVLSGEALRRFGRRNATLCARDHGAEDVELGRCMEKLRVAAGDTRDRLGRSRFHCFTPRNHLHGGYPEWYYKYDKYGAKQGVEWMSDYPVSFHYVTPDEMYDLEYFVYHLGVYGIINGLQDLNGDPTETNTTARIVTSTTSSVPPEQQQEQQQQDKREQ